MSKNVVTTILNWLYPNGYKCLSCNNEIQPNDNIHLCKNCIQTLPYINHNVCEKCGTEINGSGNYCLQCKKDGFIYQRNFPIFKYDGIIKNLIKQLKFDRKKYITNTLSKFILVQYKKLEIDVDIIIPVPLHYNRFKERGFNQASLLCTELKKSYPNKVLENVMIRTVDTPHQANLTRTNRLKNLNNCFKVINKKPIIGKSILLIDDVYTTGATLNECAKTLKQAGASSIFAITLSIAINKLSSE